MLPPGTLVNAIRSALAFVILLECFASFLSLATPDEMSKADKATIKITERRKSLGFMIQVRLIREHRSGSFCCKPEKLGSHRDRHVKADLVVLSRPLTIHSEWYRARARFRRTILTRL